MSGMRRMVLGAACLAAMLGAFAGSRSFVEASPAADAPQVTCSEISQIPLAECQALEALYNGTGGPQWYDHTDWMATVTPCSWFGVVCQPAGHVTQLNLEDNNLSGPLPDQMANLTQLSDLWMLRNRLTGTIPASWSGLTALATLDLSENLLTGPIPAHLGAFSALKTLNLADNQFAGPIPVELANLTGLRVLNLGSNALTGSVPTALSSMSSLRELSLANNLLTGTIPSQLAAITGLQRLVLADNNLTGAIPPGLGGLADLRALVLRGNALSGAIPTQLGSLSELRLLVLSGNRLSGAIPPMLGNLSNLQELWLNSNALIGAVPDTFCNLAVLSYLDLAYNALSSAPACVDTVDPFWRETQTMPPSNVQATVLSGTSVRLNWDPILYGDDGGAYEVSYRPTGGFWLVAGNTPDKHASTFTVAGLTPSTLYELRIRTFTPAHNAPPAFQQNALWSEYVTVTAQTTSGTTLRVYLPMAQAR